MEPTTVTPLHVTNSGVLEHMGAFMAQVYGWMTLGLVLTAASAIFANSAFGIAIVTNPIVFIILLIAELGIVIGLSAAAQKMHPLLAATLFVTYALINGLFFSSLLLSYTFSSVAVAFTATAGTFGVMSIYGLVTKADLTRWGNIALMGLVGLLIGLVLNIFFASDGLTWLLTFVGIAIFVVLIAYDTQKIKRYAQMAEGNGMMASYAIRGALALYLDFVNLFIRLLQIFGKRR